MLFTRAQYASNDASAAAPRASFMNFFIRSAVTFALPAATVGLWFDFEVMANQELRLDPNGSETIASVAVLICLTPSASVGS